MRNLMTPRWRARVIKYVRDADGLRPVYHWRGQLGRVRMEVADNEFHGRIQWHAIAFRTWLARVRGRPEEAALCEYGLVDTVEDGKREAERIAQAYLAITGRKTR